MTSSSVSPLFLLSLSSLPFFSPSLPPLFPPPPLMTLVTFVPSSSSPLLSSFPSELLSPPGFLSSPPPSSLCCGLAPPPPLPPDPVESEASDGSGPETGSGGGVAQRLPSASLAALLYGSSLFLGASSFRPKAVQPVCLSRPGAAGGAGAAGHRLHQRPAPLRPGRRPFLKPRRAPQKLRCSSALHQDAAGVPGAAATGPEWIKRGTPGA